MSNSYSGYGGGGSGSKVGSRGGSITSGGHPDHGIQNPSSHRDRGSSRDNNYPQRQAPLPKLFDGPSMQAMPPAFDNPSPGESVPNDCEIVTIGNPDESYVSMVENAIKDIRLKVDVMIPKQNVKISSFIENLALKGTIFAVVIRPDNVKHRSVSVHVLRGPPKPEEHRNMPLATAYTLIQKCYLELKKKEIGSLPDHIRTILRYMLEDKSLTDNEYAVVIAFLQERRKRQASFENRTPHESDKGYYSAEELQQRVLALIGGAKPHNQEPPEKMSRSMDHNPMNPLARGGSSSHGQVDNMRPYHL